MISTTIKQVGNLASAKSSSTPTPAGQSNTVPTPKPQKNKEGMAVTRYRKAKLRVKYYEIKQKVVGALSKGEQFLYDKYRTRLRKLRKIAAPELIRDLMKKRAARGKGKRRGSDLQRLMTQSKK